MIVTLRREHGHKRFRGLGLKRPERSCRRWQLEFCSWIYEESYPLGMRQATSQPPSKPMHPRFLQVLQGSWVNAGKKLALTLPNDANVTAIFLNSHVQCGQVPKPFSRRFRPAQGSGQQRPAGCGRPPPGHRHRGPWWRASPLPATKAYLSWALLQRDTAALSGGGAAPSAGLLVRKPSSSATAGCATARHAKPLLACSIGRLQA